MSIYGNPENWGLKQLGMIEDDTLSYEFDMLVVWVEATPTGTPKLYWARDSGCSCPSPFEDYRNVSDLYNLRPDTFSEFESEVTNFRGVSVTDAADLLRTVKSALAINA